jgi:ubiquinone biosynthesis accessory factor UbiK
MIDPKSVEQVLNDLRNTLPGNFAQEAEKNLRAALQAALGRLNLVTREELEVQNAVLTRTREKIAALEKQVAELEKLLRK